jgi:hypothetical protein
MNLLAHSSAVLTPSRVFSQHQAFLTLMKDRLDDPCLKEFTWLDLASGRGQVLTGIRHILSEPSRRKVRYVACEINSEHLQSAERVAISAFGRSQVTTHVCSIEDFEKCIGPHAVFDAVTFTNAAHEIAPRALPLALVGAISHTKPAGIVFIYDMETLETHELGAVPWLADEIQAIVGVLLEALGETRYVPKISRWPHKSCHGWSLQLNRRHLRLSNGQLADRRRVALVRGKAKVRELLRSKLLNVHQALDIYARYGTHGERDELEVRRLLGDHFALSRALGVPLRML